MKNKLASIVSVAAIAALLFTSCKKSEQIQVALAGDWKLSSECTGEVDRNTGTSIIYPGSGDKEVIISDIIAAMIVFYTKTGEIPVQEYNSKPSSRDLPVTTEGSKITVNYHWTDPNFDSANDKPEVNRSYTVAGNGTISDDNERITLSLTVTFPTYDPVVNANGSGPATPKPLSGTCEYTLTKVVDI